MSSARTGQLDRTRYFDSDRRTRSKFGGPRCNRSGLSPAHHRQHRRTKGIASRRALIGAFYISTLSFTGKDIRRRKRRRVSKTRGQNANKNSGGDDSSLASDPVTKRSTTSHVAGVHAIHLAHAFQARRVNKHPERALARVSDSRPRPRSSKRRNKRAHLCPPFSTHARRSSREMGAVGRKRDNRASARWVAVS